MCRLLYITIRYFWDTWFPDKEVVLAVHFAQWWVQMDGLLHDGFMK